MSRNLTRTYIIRHTSDPNFDASFYTLSVLDENNKQVFRANFPFHHLAHKKWIDRQEGIDMNQEYEIVDETIKISRTSCPYSVTNKG